MWKKQRLQNCILPVASTKIREIACSSTARFPQAQSRCSARGCSVSLPHTHRTGIPWGAAVKVHSSTQNLQSTISRNASCNQIQQVYISSNASITHTQEEHGQLEELTVRYRNVVHCPWVSWGQPSRGMKGGPMDPPDIPLEAVQSLLAPAF